MGLISFKSVFINVVLPLPFLPYICILVPNGISTFIGGVLKSSYPHTKSSI